MIRSCAERRTTEGKTKKEIIRCLKRYIAREVHASLRSDLRLLSPPLDIYRNVLVRLTETIPAKRKWRGPFNLISMRNEQLEALQALLARKFFDPMIITPYASPNIAG